MTILVSGGAGYIGSHMVNELVDLGSRVVVLDNLSTGFRSAVPEAAELVVGDIGDEALVGKLIAQRKIESIIHFAGSVVVPESVADPLGYYLNNTVKTRNLIAAAVAGGVHQFIFSSTAAVYGNPDVVPVAETARLAPLSPYGTSKMMSETMLADAARAHDLRFVALRYFNVAGADRAGRTGQSTLQATHLIKAACEASLGKRPYLEVFGTDYPTPDGTCIRDYIHVTDLARAHIAALAHLRRGGASNIYNCGYSQGYSVLEVIDAVRRVGGRDFEVRHVPRRAGDPTAIVADSTRLQTELGWKPRLDDLDLIVETALAWEDRITLRAAA